MLTDRDDPTAVHLALAGDAPRPCEARTGTTGEERPCPTHEIPDGGTPR